MAPHQDIDIVVEKGKLKTARAITDADYIKCTDQGCPELGEDRHPHFDWLPENTWEEVKAKYDAVSEGYTLHRFHPIAAAHFHIPRGYIVSLYRKSHLLWWFREIPAGAPAPDDPDIVHSTDSARLPEPGLVPGPALLMRLFQYIHSARATGHGPNDTP